MNRALNTVLFIVIATIFLSICILAIFFGLLLLLLLLLPSLDLGARALIIGILILVALIGGFFIYNIVLKVLMKKFNLGKYLLVKKS
jgi:hypothetical protein